MIRRHRSNQITLNQLRTHNNFSKSFHLGDHSNRHSNKKVIRTQKISNKIRSQAC
jgi:hypothetical protein